MTRDDLAHILRAAAQIAHGNDTAARPSCLE